MVSSGGAGAGGESPLEPTLRGYCTKDINNENVDCWRSWLRWPWPGKLPERLIGLETAS